MAADRCLSRHPLSVLVPGKSRCPRIALGFFENFKTLIFNLSFNISRGEVENPDVLRIMEVMKSGGMPSIFGCSKSAISKRLVRFKALIVEGTDLNIAVEDSAFCAAFRPKPRGVP